MVSERVSSADCAKPNVQDAIRRKAKCWSDVARCGQWSSLDEPASRFGRSTMFDEESSAKIRAA